MSVWPNGAFAHLGDTDSSANGSHRTEALYHRISVSLRSLRSTTYLGSNFGLDGMTVDNIPRHYGCKERLPRKRAVQLLRAPVNAGIGGTS